MRSGLCEPRVFPTVLGPMLPLTVVRVAALHVPAGSRDEFLKFIHRHGIGRQGKRTAMATQCCGVSEDKDAPSARAVPCLNRPQGARSSRGTSDSRGSPRPAWDPPPTPAPALGPARARGAQRTTRQRRGRTRRHPSRSQRRSWPASGLGRPWRESLARRMLSSTEGFPGRAPSRPGAIPVARQWFAVPPLVPRPRLPSRFAAIPVARRQLGISPLVPYRACFRGLRRFASLSGGRQSRRSFRIRACFRGLQ